jgi:ribosomal-protein-alanine N-acetyltransferase
MTDPSCSRDVHSGETTHPPLVTDLVAVETVDTDFVADALASADDPSRRHDDWHPDFPRRDDRDGLGMVREVTDWSPRVIRRRADGLVVGTVGFFGPPEPADDGVPEVEIGYGLVAAARRQGLMRDALAVLLAWTDSIGVRVRGATTRANAASLASMAGAGFLVVAEDPDDVERQVLLVRPLRPSAG